MKHQTLQLNISEWLTAERIANDAIIQFIEFMAERDWRSFELELSSLLKNFVGRGADQRNIVDEDHTVFTSCMMKDDILLFVDIEAPEDNDYVIELDIFAPESAFIENEKDPLIENVMKCFGLTSSKESLVYKESTDAFSGLRSRLNRNSPISDALYQQLKGNDERAILRELKKRGSILERDLGELQLTMPADRITRVLDYFSGEEFRLVDRKFAIVCKDTQEIVFLIQSKEQIENTAALQCPKCARHINDETVMPYYSMTEELKILLDGNRWMPLLVRDSLMKAGVPKDDILTEVKYSEDEIDVLVFYRGRVFVIELKNRPVNLNDAYKLSAKTSRLESILSKLDGYRVSTYNAARRRRQVVTTVVHGRPALSTYLPIGTFIPVIITTHDVAKDAVDLLKETRDTAQFLEQCEGKMDDFIKKIIGDIAQQDLVRRFSELTSQQADSVGELASTQIGRAFEAWRDER